MPVAARRRRRRLADGAGTWHRLREAGGPTVTPSSRWKERILPLYDAELTRPVVRRLGRSASRSFPARGVKGLSAKGDGLRCRGPQDGAIRQIAGRQDPRHRRAQPGHRGVGGRGDRARHGRPVHAIDERCAPSMRGVFAIGDVTGEPMLAHRAMAQGEMVAEIVAGHRRALGTPRHPGRLLHRSGDRQRRPLARRRASSAGREVPCRALPLRRQRPRPHPARRGGFVRVVGARRQPPGARHPGGGARRVRACRSAFGLAFEMGARPARTSPARSTPTRRWARRSMRRR